MAASRTTRISCRPSRRLLTAGSLPLTFTLMAVVKEYRRRGRTRVSIKNQVTIPVDALRSAGIRAGDELKVESAGGGRIMLAKADDPMLRYAGVFKGVFRRGYLKKLRGEWRS